MKISVDKTTAERGYKRGRAMSDFKIVGKKAKVDQCYGLEAFHITKEEIAALLAGKKLYSTVNCGEYAITIELGERVTIPESNNSKSEWQKDHEILKAYSDGANEVLDKIRAEIDTYLEIEGFGSEYRNDVKKIIDKYKAESEET